MLLNKCWLRLKEEVAYFPTKVGSSIKKPVSLSPGNDRSLGSRAVKRSFKKLTVQKLTVINFCNHDFVILQVSRSLVKTVYVLSRGLCGYNGYTVSPGTERKAKLRYL